MPDVYVFWVAELGLEETLATPWDDVGARLEQWATCGDYVVLGEVTRGRPRPDVPLAERRWAIPWLGIGYHALHGVGAAPREGWKVPGRPPWPVLSIPRQTCNTCQPRAAFRARRAWILAFRHLYEDAPLNIAPPTALDDPHAISRAFHRYHFGDTAEAPVLESAIAMRAATDDLDLLLALNAIQLAVDYGPRGMSGEPACNGPETTLPGDWPDYTGPRKWALAREAPSSGWTRTGRR